MNPLLSILSLLVMLGACKPGEQHETGRPGDSAAGPPRYSRYEDCPRGEPTPILRKDAFPTRTFRLDEKSGLGLETLALDGDTLLIEHGGCEYAVSTFYFDTDAPDPTDSKWAIRRKAIKMLHRLIDGMESPALYREGAKMLSERIATGRLKMGEAYEFGELKPGGIVNTVSVKEMEALPNGRLRIRVDFEEGPVKN